ncbi:MAG TPA: glutaconyl-CoA decarboxylase subunit delta [Selenomonas sp.]|nr:glutaconyl-CoA decarboxylase subunit delta [Selenomonas sp.]
MGHPVTTNPFIIMLINMTIVFIVLVSLSFVIRLIHYVDPTVKKEAPKEAPKVAPAPPVEEPEPVAESGVSGEVIAVISAALAAYGCSAGQIRAVRPIDRQGWKQSGRFQGGNTQ